MKSVKCKNCGAAFSDNLSCCPYCGTMNKKGAYAEFRKKVSSVVDAILGLKEDVQRSVSRIILSSLLRSLLFIALIAGLAFLASRNAKVNYYNDREYDQQAYEEIVWMDENLDRLNEAYASGDYQTVRTLYYRNTKAVSKWTGYPSFCLREEYEKIQNAARFDEYQLQKVLYFLFYPEYHTGRNGMNYVDRAEYEEMTKALTQKVSEKGYTAEELRSIYDGCADSYGYINASDLREYVKEVQQW